MGLSWACLGLSWVSLGLSWAYLGQSWASLRLVLGCLRLVLGLSWPSWMHLLPPAAMSANRVGFLFLFAFFIIAILGPRFWAHNLDQKLISFWFHVWVEFMMVLGFVFGPIWGPRIDPESLNQSALKWNNFRSLVGNPAEEAYNHQFWKKTQQCQHVRSEVWTGTHMCAGAPGCIWAPGGANTSRGPGGCMLVCRGPGTHTCAGAPGRTHMFAGARGDANTSRGPGDACSYAEAPGRRCVQWPQDGCIEPFKAYAS